MGLPLCMDYATESTEIAYERDTNSDSGKGIAILQPYH